MTPRAPSAHPPRSSRGGAFDVDLRLVRCGCNKAPAGIDRRRVDSDGGGDSSMSTDGRRRRRWGRDRDVGKDGGQSDMGGGGGGI